MKKKILFVGMIDSPHFAKWINLVIDQDWDLHVFPVYLAEPHRLLRGVTIHQPWIKMRPRHYLKKFIRNPRSLFSSKPNNIKIRSIYPLPLVSLIIQFLSGYKSAPLGESDVCAPLFFGPHVLARLIKKLKPDLIHSMEFQHAGYNVLRTKEFIGNKCFPKWLATNWGSDIFYYRHFPAHNQQISRLLRNIDYYSCECERDLELAQSMGFSATAMPIFPNTGGFDLDAIAELRNLVRPSNRRIIMVKGYQHFAGRALIALNALLTCASILTDYRIIVFSASKEVNKKIEELQASYALNILSIPYSDHEKMLEFFAHSRLYLGVSISDAISTSMLEAMAMGAFPIQTNTACCSEWIKDGVSGFSIPPDDIAVIGDRIRKAIIDDELVDKAAEINWSTACERLDHRVLKLKEVAFYEHIFANIEQSSYSNAH